MHTLCFQSSCYVLYDKVQKQKSASWIEETCLLLTEECRANIATKAIITADEGVPSATDEERRGGKGP